MCVHWSERRSLQVINSISLATSGLDTATAVGLYFHPETYWTSL